MLRHEEKDMQKLAMFWHALWLLCSLGGVVYHAIAVAEHARSAQNLTNSDKRGNVAKWTTKCITNS